MNPAPPPPRPRAPIMPANTSRHRLLMIAGQPVFSCLVNGEEVLPECAPLAALMQTGAIDLEQARAAVHGGTLSRDAFRWLLLRVGCSLVNYRLYLPEDTITSTPRAAELAPTMHQLACEVLHFSPQDAMIKSQALPIVRARGLAMWGMRTLARLPDDVTAEFYGMVRSVVSHACQRIASGFYGEPIETAKKELAARWLDVQPA